MARRTARAIGLCGDGVYLGGTVEPAEILGAVHLHCGEALPDARAGSIGNVGGAIATDPGIDRDAIAHPSAQQLINRHPQLARLDIPQCLIDPGDGRQQDRPAAIEAEPVQCLPRVLDAVGIMPDQAIARCVDRPDDGFAVPFQRRLAPAYGTLRRLDPAYPVCAIDDHGFVPVGTGV
jgi:hypothetical protein